MQILPQYFNSDGFYIASLKKVWWMMEKVIDGMKAVFMTDRGKVRQHNEDNGGIVQVMLQAI